MLSNLELYGPELALTEAETALLRHIYHARIRLFVVVYILLLLIGLQSAMPIKGSSPVWKKENGYRHERGQKETGTAGRQLYKITVPLLELLVTCTGILVYCRRIAPLRKDIRNGFKETVYYTVTQKQYFEHTGQYFIGLNHPDYLFHEVGAAMWQGTDVGDPFAVYRAPASRYVFNPRGKYTIM